MILQKLDFITFGEAMAMFIADTPGALSQVDHYTRGLAGAETNVAIGLARLGFHSGWISKIGQDSFGQFILNRLKVENVNIENVFFDEKHPTGFQMKSKVLAGDPEVQYFRKGSAASFLGINDFDENYFKSASHLHVTGIPLALSKTIRDFAKHAVKFMKKEGKTVSFDPNLRPTLWNSKEEMIREINHMAFEANYVLPGVSEGKILTGFKNPSDIASFYLDKGVELVVIKLGEKGAYYKTAKSEGNVSAFEVKQVIDTVGAGDGFAVGLISGLFEKLSLPEAIQRGNAIGAMAVQSIGDNDGYPTKRELDEFLNNQLEGVK